MTWLHEHLQEQEDSDQVDIINAEMAQNHEENVAPTLGRNCQMKCGLLGPPSMKRTEVMRGSWRHFVEIAAEISGFWIVRDRSYCIAGFAHLLSLRMGQYNDARVYYTCS